MYIRRHLASKFSSCLRLFPAVAITGPRQSGKTSFIKEEFSKGKVWINFNDPFERRNMEEDPQGFMKRIRYGAVIDEAWKAPLIFECLKTEIDKDRVPGRYILTGSNRIATDKLGKSLKDTIAALSLLPFGWTERLGIGTPEEALLYGNFPELAIRRGFEASAWFSKYLETCLEKDILSCGEIAKTREFLAFIQLLAARCSEELNMSIYARELGVTEKTIQAWIGIMEANYLVFLVPSYHQTYGKRIIRRPKAFFWDTGIVNHLSGASSGTLLENGPSAQPVFKNFIASEIMKTIAHTGNQTNLFWFKTNGGLEIDFILENKNRKTIDFITLNRSHSKKPEMLHALRRILSDHVTSRWNTTWKATGTLVYRGETEPLGPSIRFVNYLEFLVNLV